MQPGRGCEQAEKQKKKGVVVGQRKTKWVHGDVQFTLWWAQLQQMECVCADALRWFMGGKSHRRRRTALLTDEALSLHFCTFKKVTTMIYFYSCLGFSHPLPLQLLGTWCNIKSEFIFLPQLLTRTVPQFSSEPLWKLSTRVSSHCRWIAEARLLLWTDRSVMSVCE